MQLKNITIAYPPGPSISRLEALLLTVRRRGILEFLTRVARSYGDIAHFQIGSRRVYLLNHPDYIKDALTRYYESFAKGRPRSPGSSHFLRDGLLTSEGDLHRSQRRIISPAFHKQQLEVYASEIMKVGVSLRDRWRNGQHVDIMSEMKSLSLDIISNLVFGAQVKDEADEINEAVQLVVSQFSPFGSPLGSLLSKLPLSRERRIHHAQQRLDRLVYRIIAERRSNRNGDRDLLSMLMDARDDSGAPLSDDRIRDEVMTFFLAGHETVGTALGWTWYLLAHNPEAQAKLHAELDNVLGDRAPTFDDVPKLQYTRMVFSEAMRIYPPAWILARYLVKDFETGDYRLPAGSIVIISQFLMHRDARYFPDPTRFDPERWSPEAKASRPRYSYFPFGGGPRGCLGEGLSWLEGSLAIAALAQRWQMQPVSANPVEFKPRLTLQSKNKILIRLERRDEIASRLPRSDERPTRAAAAASGQTCPVHR